MRNKLKKLSKYKRIIYGKKEEFLHLGHSISTKD